MMAVVMPMMMVLIDDGVGDGDGDYDGDDAVIVLFGVVLLLGKGYCYERVLSLRTTWCT